MSLQGNNLKSPGVTWIFTTSQSPFTTSQKSFKTSFLAATKVVAPYFSPGTSLRVSRA